MSSKRYVALSQDADSTEKGLSVRPVNASPRCTAITLVLSLTLLTSLALNILSFSRLRPASPSTDSLTRFAGLARNVSKTIEYHSPFNDPDRAKEDAAWASKLVDPTTLVVALSDSFTEPRDVLHSMRWPWDSTKGVYTLNSAHELHCLHLIRNTVNHAYDNEPQEWPRMHTVHCLEYLLQSIMCNADDTLLYQGLLHENRKADHPLGGLGDTRQCRDWGEMQAWAQRHSACYDPLYRENDPDLLERERYKFCPDGSRPWENV